jgi:gamma-glutamyltranspeptidase/glutathione hydrolase
VPLDLLLSKERAAMRLELLSMAAPRVAAPVTPGSNHLTVADEHGNVATLLHSCMSTPWSNGLFAGGVSVCAAGAHYLRVQPRPGDRISSIVAPNMLCRDGRPLLTSGSPSTGLLANVLQNIVNVVDFGIDLETSVHKPRFGGPSASDGMEAGGFLTEIESDLDPAVRDGVAARGVHFDVVNPWQYHLGSFEGIARDPDTDVLTAAPDPRRNSAAEGY